MRIVFFGTPDYVLPVLTSLHKTFKGKSTDSPIAAVVTQKPRPAGRKQTLAYSPIDTWAHKKNVPKYYHGNDLLENKLKADVGILASYGAIIPKKVINIFPYGILNIHLSLLPKFRGASPVRATLVTGDESGVTIIKIDEKLDHGPIISQFQEKVKAQDTTDSLRARLFSKSAEVIKILLPAYLKGKITLKEQDHKSATFTTLVKKADGFIPPKYLRVALKGEKIKGEWKIPFIKNYSLNPTPYTLERFIRAMQPWPVSWTYVQLNAKLKTQNSKRLKILKAHLEPFQATSYKLPAAKLVLDGVQLEGKNPVSWKQFQEGYATVMFE